MLIFKYSFIDTFLIKQAFTRWEKQKHKHKTVLHFFVTFAASFICVVVK